MYYYEQNIGDYRKDTGHLSLLEHGVYRQLLDTYYLSEKPLTLDFAQLKRAHCVRSEEEVKALENVLSDFFTRTEDGYVHKRCEEVIAEYKGKSVKASASAKVRWGKEKQKQVDLREQNTNAIRTQCERNANAYQTQCDEDANGMLTINHKPITNNHKPKEEQKKINKKKSSHETLKICDLASEGVDEQTAEDWIAHRKTKKASASRTVLEDRKSQAFTAGISLSDALKIEISRGWQGFQADWIMRPRASPTKPEKFNPNDYVNANFGRGVRQNERTIQIDEFGEPV